MILALQIIFGALAVALGIYLGLPGRYDRSQEEVERALSEGRHRRHWTKRHFTPLDLLRKDKKGSERRRGVRRPFQTVAPKRKDDEEEDRPPQVSLGRR